MPRPADEIGISAVRGGTIVGEHEIIFAGTDEVIFLYHSAGKNTCFDLFSFSVSYSEADGWIFMLIAHGNAPFVWLWQ